MVWQTAHGIPRGGWILEREQRQPQTPGVGAILPVASLSGPLSTCCCLCCLPSPLPFPVGFSLCSPSLLSVFSLPPSSPHPCHVSLQHLAPAMASRARPFSQLPGFQSPRKAPLPPCFMPLPFPSICFHFVHLYLALSELPKNLGGLSKAFCTHNSK